MATFGHAQQSMIRLRYVKTARVGRNTITCSCNSIASTEDDERRIFTTTTTTKETTS